MPTYYDDNFGHYKIESEEDVEFYKEVQRTSVWKKCLRCERKVRLRPDYVICNRCADADERGWGY